MLVLGENIIFFLRIWYSFSIFLKFFMLLYVIIFEEINVL